MQEVSGVYTSPFLHTDERKIALQVRKVSGAFVKWARPGSFDLTIGFEIVQDAKTSILTH